MNPNIILSYKKIFYTFILIYVFILGGMTQFFVGISNTISSYLIGLTVIVFQLIINLNSFKINRPSIVIQFAVLTIVYIIVNGIFINNAGILKSTIYLYFVFLPIAAIYIADYFIINPTRKKILINLLTVVALIQLPVLVIQKFTYDIFSSIRLSDKVVHEIDFSFGTFFMANDHALGFFLICFLLYASKKYRGAKFISILSIVIFSVLLTNSKYSYLLLLLALTYLFINHFKFGKLLVLISIPILICLAYFFLNSLDYNQLLNLNNAEKFYNSGEASRQQIIFILLEQGISLFGQGPYSYFDIESGTFESAQNFSQWIWNYFDLGLIGVIFFTTYTFIIYSQQKTKNHYSLLITCFLLFYGFFTNYTTDLNMLITYIIFIRI